MGNVRKSEVLQKRERRILVETIRKEDEVIEFVAIVEDFKFLFHGECVCETESILSFICFWTFFFQVRHHKIF